MWLAVVSLREARKVAVALPEATEEDHFGRHSFRIRGRIFATVPDPHHLNVMLDPFDVDGVVRETPEACSALMWGKKVAGVSVDLDQATKDVVAHVLHAAWRRKAPRRLLEMTAGER